MEGYTLLYKNRLTCERFTYTTQAYSEEDARNHLNSQLTAQGNDLYDFVVYKVIKL